MSTPAKKEPYWENGTLYRHDGRKLCAAKKRSGEHCRALAMANGRCRVHGGKTPVGKELPQTTHGRSSKHLPTRLQSRIEAALQDGDLLSLREEIAVTNARIEDLYRRVDSGESGALYRDLKAAQARVDAAVEAEEMRDAMRALRKLIGQGSGDWNTWEDIKALQKHKASLVEAEGKRLEKMQQMMTAEQVGLILATVQDSIIRNVPDPAARAAIQRDVQAVLNKG